MNIKDGKEWKCKAHVFLNTGYDDAVPQKNREHPQFLTVMIASV